MSRPSRFSSRAAQLLCGCPACGGRWARVSGLLVCQRCGHRSGSVVPHWQAYPDSRPRDAATGRVLPTSTREDQDESPDDWWGPPRQRRYRSPLDFDADD